MATRIKGEIFVRYKFIENEDNSLKECICIIHIQTNSTIKNP